MRFVLETHTCWEGARRKGEREPGSFFLVWTSSCSVQKLQGLQHQRAGGGAGGAAHLGLQPKGSHAIKVPKHTDHEGKVIGSSTVMCQEGQSRLGGHWKWHLSRGLSLPCRFLGLTP